MCVRLNIHQRVRKGESKSKFEGCRARNVQTVFDAIRTEAKRVKAQTAHANSSKAKLRPN